MNPAPSTPDLQALAPDVARRFTLIIAALAALIARVFLHNPRLLPLFIPLCNRLNRAARRFSTLMARIAANQHPKRRPGRVRPGSRKPRPPIPTSYAWLIRAIPYEAAGLGAQLAHLLAEPGVAELLAAAPSAQRLLNPIRHALALSPKPPWPKRKRAPAPKATPAERAPPPTKPRPLYPTLQAFRPFPPRRNILKPA